MKKKTPQIVSTKTYTFAADFYNDDTWVLRRLNDGFDPLELLGLASLIQIEIVAQLRGDIKPKIIKRQVVVSGGK